VRVDPGIQPTQFHREVVQSSEIAASQDACLRGTVMIDPHGRLSNRASGQGTRFDAAPQEKVCVFGRSAPRPLDRVSGHMNRLVQVLEKIANGHRSLVRSNFLGSRKAANPTPRDCARSVSEALEKT